MTSRANEPMHAFEYDEFSEFFGERSRTAHPGITIREHAAIQIAAKLATDRGMNHAAVCEEAVSLTDRLMVELEKTR